MQVGIIGGGQLALMLCEAAQNLGLKTAVLDPNSNCSSKNICDLFINANYDDIKAIEQLAKVCDVVTYEFENVDTKTIDYINEKYQNVIQTSKPLKLANNRIIEKEAALNSSFEPVKFSVITNRDDLQKFIFENKFPVVIKTTKFGYDGKGQMVISSDQDLDCPIVTQIISSGAVCEKYIDLNYEISIIAIRNKHGQIKLMPPAKNVHKNNILYSSTIEENEQYDEICQKVKNYITYHDLIGIITVEVFVDKNGNIYFNEMAPRPHNSGHYSIEGCNYSQFDMHLRCICDRELPNVKLLAKSKMLNVLGQNYLQSRKWIETNPIENIYFHDYGKEEVIENRKMAHITAVGHQAIEKLNEIEILFGEKNE